MPGNGHRHDADRSSARDQHILADEIERQRRMRRVAERIEDSGEVVGNFRWNLESVERRNDEEFGERPWAIHAYAHCIAAKMPAARTTVPAESAGDMTFARHAV